MTDWTVAVESAASGTSAEQLTGILRSLGCERGLGGQVSGGTGCAFLVGTRLGRSPRDLVAGDEAATVLLDGRLDNRAEVASRIGLEAGELTDSQLLLAIWRRAGDDAFAALEGPFAAVIWDHTSRRLVLARDVLGDQCLSYHRPRHRTAPFLIAPDAAALLAAPGVSREGNERSLARLLAMQGPRSGETYFAEVEEVPPGHLVSWTRETGVTCRRFASLEPDAAARDERDPVARLRELLTTAVAHCLGDPRRTGLLLSGGLDSSAIATRAADIRPVGERPVAISWIFEELAAGDDTAAIAALVGSLEMPWEPIVADDLWPLGGERPLSPGSTPLADIYQRLQDAAFTRASALGLDVVLCGQFGDHLWVEGGWWLRDLLRRGRLDLAGAALIRQWQLDRRDEPRRGSARGAVARLLPRRSRPSGPPEWLTPEARAIAALEPEELAPPRGARAEQWAAIVHPLGPSGIHSTRMNAARWGIEMRYPYRSRPLVEWMLGLPADRLYSPGATKLLLRQMLRAEAPDAVAGRKASTTLLPLAVRGLVTNEGARVRALLRDPEALWPRYVNRHWLQARFPDELAAGRDGAPTLVGWLCLCVEAWRRNLAARALAA